MSKSSEFIIIVLIILLTITCTLLYTNKCDCNCSVKQTSNDVDTLRRFEQNENTSQISIPQLKFKEENLSIDYNSKDSLSSSSNIPLDKQLIGSNWIWNLDAFYHACRKLHECSKTIGKMGLNHKTSHVKPPQFLQAMILHYIFENIKPTSKYFIEFGFDSDSYAGGGGANTGYLKYMRSWTGLLLDMEHRNHKINLHKHGIITPEVIVSLFHSHNVPKDVDYLSIDVDSVDIFMLNSILKDGYYRPKVISIEYNCYFPIESTIANIGYHVHNHHTLNESKLFYVSNTLPASGSRFYGTSLKNIFLLAEKYDYSVVAVDISVDAFLVRNDLLETNIKLFDLEHYRSACTRHLFKQTGSTSGTKLQPPSPINYNRYNHNYDNHNKYKNDKNIKNSNDASPMTDNPTAPTSSSTITTTKTTTTTRRHLRNTNEKKKSQTYLNKEYNPYSTTSALSGKPFVPSNLRKDESIADSPMDCWCMGPRQKTKNTTYFRDYIVDFEVYLRTGDAVLANGGNDIDSDTNYPGSFLDRMSKKYGMNFQQRCRNRDHDFDVSRMAIGSKNLNAPIKNKFDSSFSRPQDFLNPKEFEIKKNELKRWIQDNQVLNMGV